MTRPERAHGKEYADALSSLLSEGAKREAATVEESAGARSERKGGKRPIVMVLLFTLFFVAGWSVYQYLRPPEPPSAETQQRAGRIMLFHAVQAIEVHRASRGALPSHLSLLDIPEGDYEYLRADTGYTVYLTMPDAVVIFRSGTDPASLLDQAGIR